MEGWQFVKGTQYIQEMARGEKEALAPVRHAGSTCSTCLMSALGHVHDGQQGHRSTRSKAVFLF